MMPLEEPAGLSWASKDTNQRECCESSKCSHDFSCPVLIIAALSLQPIAYELKELAQACRL